MSQLAEAILSQKHIGSAIKQSISQEDDSDDEEMEDVDPNQVGRVEFKRRHLGQPHIERSLKQNS